MMKKLIGMTMGALMSAAAFAATPAELIGANKWDEYANLPWNVFTNNLPKAKADAAMEGCLVVSNYTRVGLAAAYGYFDATKAFDALKALPLEQYDISNSILIGMQHIVNGTKNLDLEATIIEKALAAPEDQQTNVLRQIWVRNALISNNFAVERTDEFLRLASKALTEKKYIVASAPIAFWPHTKLWADASPEKVIAWRKENLDAVMDGYLAYVLERADNVSLVNIFNATVFNVSKIDLFANDKDNAAAMKWFNTKLFGNAKKLTYSGKYLVKWVYGKAQYDAFIKNSTNGSAIYAQINRLPVSMRANAVKANWKKIGANKTVALTAALQLKDVDKVIDALLLTTDNISAASLKSVIRYINGLDADYRAEDVSKVLRNINAKYTLKLYDDRDTWEPILAKIRAMIDVR